MMRLTLALIPLLLSGCASTDMLRGAIAERAAGTMTRAVDTAQWQLCTAISARELIERYGAPGRWEAWQELCGYTRALDSPGQQAEPSL